MTIPIMMNKITPEELYNIYHRERLYITKGIYPKPIVNWEKIYNNPTWVYFIQLADMLYRSAGQIDSTEYITSIVHHFKKNVSPKVLITQKGIKVYRHYIVKKFEDGNDDNKINQIKQSIKFVASFCKENNIINFIEYFHHNEHIFPTLIKHFNSGKISKFFIYLIPNLVDRFDAYPKDIKDEYFDYKFMENYSTFNILVNENDVLTKISDNFEHIINSLINK